MILELPDPVFQHLRNIVIWAALYDEDRNGAKNRGVYEAVLPYLETAEVVRREKGEPVPPRYTEISKGIKGCLDCGNVVFSEAAHTRFHSILSGHAWSLAVLKTSHIAAHVHDKYDVVERIDSRKFDSWSADALAEVIADKSGKGSEGV